MDEARVVNRLMAGDSAAAERIVNQYGAVVYQYCLRFLGNPSEAEDATTDVFLRLFAQMGPEAAETSVREWIMRIAVNVCADWQKHHRGHRHTEPVETLEQQIQLALQRLVRQQRAIILLRDLNGLDEKEIGAILEVDERTVLQRLARARNNLCDFLLQSGVQLGGGQVERARSKQSQWYRELCSRYVDENVTPEEKKELLDHIQECASCAAYLEGLTQIGRELSHMMDAGMPELLKEDIMNAVRLQAEKAREGIRQRVHLPLFTLIFGALALVILICSGVFGGLFISNDTSGAANGSAQEVATESVNLDGMKLPDGITANSYAFAIAAVNGTGMPEMSTEAELIAVDERTGAAFYKVASDVAAVERLTESLESFGYTAASVYDSRIMISGAASNGLIVVLDGENA